MPKVLVVDDEPDERRLLGDLLGQQGFAVRTAARADHALDMARSEAPDVLLADVHMPEMDGYALCRAWMADPELRDIPLLFLTANYTGASDVEMGRRLGAADYVLKPIGPAALRVRIEAALRRARPADAAVAPVRSSEIEDRRGLEQELAATKARLLEVEARVQRMQRLEDLGALAGGVAHDFNNLLSVILTCAELALEETAEDDPRAQDLQDIRAAGERSRQLTRQLLAFSRHERSVEERLDVNEVARALEPMLHRLLGDDVQLAMELRGPLPAVRMGRSQLEQCLVNLSVNARDAMPRGGSLRVETGTLVEGAARHVFLRVVDTGQGMDADTLRRIFEPFFTTKGPGAGTGLGLANLRSLVEEVGGEVRVRSQPGVGSAFTIQLPPAGPAPAATPDSSMDLGLPRGSETVLLVEDESSVRHVARRVLERLGYRVLAAPHAGIAIVQAEREVGPVHLVLADVVMPHMSGGELVDRLRREQPGLRALFTTGYSDARVAAHGLPAGAEILRKPFTPKDLSRAVRRVLDRPG